METVSRRLRRLEDQMAPATDRTIVVFSGGASEDEVAAGLKAKGIRIGGADQLVHFATIYEDRDGSPAPNLLPMSISVVENRTSRRVV